MRAASATRESLEATVERVIRERLVLPVFQPIVELATRATVAVEALARGPAGSPLEFPDRLFEAARRVGRLNELDMICAERALEEASADPPPMVFVNAEPAALDQPLSPRLLGMLGAGLPFPMALEYTERSLARHPAALLGIAAGVHAFGNYVAFDDVGADPMSLAFLPLLEPEFIKLDMHLLHDPFGPATTDVATAVTAIAERTGAIVLAEGIETEADLGHARALGATWGQGWLFGRPGPLRDLTGPLAPPVLPTRPASDPRAEGDLFDVAAASAPTRVGDLAACAALLAHMTRLADREPAHTVVLGWYDDPAVVVDWMPYLHRLGRDAAFVGLAEPPDGPRPGSLPGRSQIAFVVTSPYHAAALCVRVGRDGTVELVHTQQRSTVEALARTVLGQVPDAISPGR